MQDSTCIITLWDCQQNYPETDAIVASAIVAAGRGKHPGIGAITGGFELTHPDARGSVVVLPCVQLKAGRVGPSIIS